MSCQRSFAWGLAVPVADVRVVGSKRSSSCSGGSVGAGGIACWVWKVVYESAFLGGGGGRRTRNS